MEENDVCNHNSEVKMLNDVRNEKYRNNIFFNGSGRIKL